MTETDTQASSETDGEKAAESPLAAARTWLATSWRRVDPLVVVVCVVALITYVLHGFDGVLSRDVAIYSYSAQQAVAGTPPYVSILNRAGPLAHLIPAFGVGAARVFNMDDLFAIRLLFMAISVACIGLTYACGRSLFRSRGAGLAAAAALLCFQGFIDFATYGPREKTSLVAFLLLTVLAVSKRWWLVAGAAAACAALTWQPAALVGVVLLVGALVGAAKAQRVRAFLLVLAGGLAPITVVFAYLAATGAWDEFIEATLVINARYTVRSPLLKHAHDFWDGLNRGFGVSQYVAMVGIVVLLADMVRRIVKGGRRFFADLQVFIGLAGLLTVLWTLYDFNWWPDVLFVLPFAALGIGALASLLVGALRNPTARAAVLGAWLVVAVVGAMTFSVTQRNTELVAQRAEAMLMTRSVPRNATYLSIQAPQALVLKRKTSITRHQMYIRGLQLYLDDTYPGGLEGLAEWVKTTEPTVVTWSTDFDHKLGGLRGVVRNRYTKMGKTTGWLWYVHNSVNKKASADADQ